MRRAIARNGTKFALALMAAILVGLVAAGSDGRGFRQAQRIPTPELLSEGRDASSFKGLGGLALDQPIPIPRPDVKAALETIFNRWGKGDTRLALNANFVNRDRLADLIRDLAPRDARLRVLEVANIEVLDQAIQPGEGPNGRDLLISRVATTATTQLTFTDRVNNRFQTLSGTNDYVIQMFHAIRREGDQ